MTYSILAEIGGRGAGWLPIEELLRRDSPVQLTMRIPTEPVEFAGVRFEPHQAVVTVLGAANHAPEAFAQPDVLDLGRAANEHVSLGHGIHFLPRRAAGAAGGAGSARRTRPPVSRTCDS